MGFLRFDTAKMDEGDGAARQAGRQMDRGAQPVRGQGAAGQAGRRTGGQTDRQMEDDRGADGQRAGGSRTGGQTYGRRHGAQMVDTLSS